MTRSRTVLLVDDDPEIVNGAKLRLRAAGYDTVTAHDGEQGVATAIEITPDVIVLDVRMPRKDGLQALQELKQNEATRNIPIIMLSASLVDQQRALDAGARFFLTKPYAGKSLLDAIETALGERRRCMQPGTSS